MRPPGRPKGVYGSAPREGNPVSPVSGEALPGADDALKDDLLAGAQTLGLALSAPQASALLAYLALMQRWNAVFNLTAVRAPADMLRQHLLDCLSVVPALRREASGSAWGQGGGEVNLLDVGSGGGLPGVVLAIMEPRWRVFCVDAVGKKASFVRQVAGELQLPNLHAVHARVERWSAPHAFQLITSRAFASLADFVELTRPKLSEGGIWMAMKGLAPAQEQAELPSGVEVFHVERLRVPGLEAQRCLVWIRQVHGSGGATPNSD